MPAKTTSESETVEVAGIEVDANEYREIQNSAIKRHLLNGICNDCLVINFIHQVLEGKGQDVSKQTVRNYLNDLGKAGLAKTVGQRTHNGLWTATDDGEAVIEHLKETYEEGF